MAREKIQQIIAELNQTWEQSQNDTVKALCCCLVMKLESAIRSQWVPIGDPPKKPCFAFVRTIEGDVDVTHYMGDLGWGGYDLDDLTHWHAIEYPEPTIDPTVETSPA